MFPSCIADIHVHFDFESIVILHILHVYHFLLVEFFKSHFIYKLFSYDDRDDALGHEQFPRCKFVASQGARSRSSEQKCLL